MKKRWGGGLLILAVLIGYACYVLLKPLDIRVSFYLKQLGSNPITATNLDYQRAAIGYIDPSNNSILCRPLGEGDNYTIPRATASIAKLITVQVVLDKYPLEASASSEVITMTSDDEARYWNSVNMNGSSVRVWTGEQITVRQLLEGILLASANNMADSLAIWVFGSMDGYRTAANGWLREHGLTSTTVGSDASGYDPSTTSTPTDICKIMLLATQNPILSEIMSEGEATMPDGEVIHNTNKLLGQGNIFAGKTGYTDAAGRGMVVASRHDYFGLPVTTAAVSLSHDSYQGAFDAVNNLTSTIKDDLRAYHVNTGYVIGRVQGIWGGYSELITTKELTTLYWADEPPIISGQQYYYYSDSISKHTVIGRLLVGNTSTGIVLKNQIDLPDWRWRLAHPFI